MKYRRVYKVDRGRTYDKDDLLIYINTHIRKRYRIFFYDMDKEINYRAVLDHPRSKYFSIQRYNPVFLSWEEIYDLRNF